MCSILNNSLNLYAALFRVFAKGMLPNAVFKLLLDQGHFKFDEMYTAHIEAFLYCVLDSNFPRETILTFENQRCGPPHHFLSYSH